LHVIKAGNGGDGSGDEKYRTDGDDKYIEVPLGTVVKTKKQAKSCLKLLRTVKASTF
jgi:GTP-binding protein